jgi:uncharacterized protein
MFSSRHPTKVKKKAPRHPAAPFQRRLVVMAKAPVAGRAKTRLARQIGTASALRFARQSLLALIARLAADRRWQTMIAVTPLASLAGRLWPRGIPRVPQRPGDLGARMQAIANQLPAGPVIIIGTDVPRIGPTDIAKAFHLLGSHDAVFGPAVDGGYWLVGLRRRPRQLQPFGNVRWSSKNALCDTLVNLQGRQIALLTALADVDDADAFRAHAAHFGRRIQPRVQRRPNATPIAPGAPT